MPLDGNDKLSIENPSQELLRRTIESVPLIPPCGNISFIADGLVMGNAPAGITEEELYFSDCEKANIIPYSHIRLGYDNNSKSFTSKPTYRSEKIIPSKQKSVEGLLKGGRMHIISIDTGDDYLQEEGFKKFKEFMPMLLGNSYEISNIDFWLTTYSLRGYNEGTYADTVLSYKRELDKKKLSLKIGHRISDENKENVISWFEEL